MSCAYPPAPSLNCRLPRHSPCYIAMPCFAEPLRSMRALRKNRPRDPRSHREPPAVRSIAGMKDDEVRMSEPLGVVDQRNHLRSDPIYKNFIELGGAVGAVFGIFDVKQAQGL